MLCVTEIILYYTSRSTHSPTVLDIISVTLIFMIWRGGAETLALTAASLTNINFEKKGVLMLKMQRYEM